MLLIVGLVFAIPQQTGAQVTTPMEELGVNIGDDYHLFTYTQFEAYWRKLAEESPRMILEEIGQTAEGRTQLMAIITSPENHRNLARYKEISHRLSSAEGLTDEEARRLANEGKAVVWIDGGLHASEIVGSHQLMEMVYQLVSRTDEETMRFLDDIIILAAHANPDGMELVSSWYMRMEEPTERSTSGLPRLYHKYVGHDNNRDAYMVAMPETENMARILYREWNPQIMYNHHQSGPAGTVLFAPPYRKGIAYNIEPLVYTGIESVGAAMHARFVAEGKPGSAMRSIASYSTTWSGCMRCTPYWFHTIGILTEINGNPTPMEIPLIPDRQLASNDIPYPIAPQKWHFRQAIDYSITANRAILDYASRNRDYLLYSRYIMGRNSIEKGSRDHWTIEPKDIEELKLAGSGQEIEARRAQALPSHLYEQVLHDPAKRDPRGYIIPADQPDFPTATKFVNALIKNGTIVHRATQDFTVGGEQYAAGSYIVKTAQAFRPHVMDSFEPQDVLDEFLYPGGPPVPPYDVTGWTLAFQMGVEFDRILDGFDGPFEQIEGFAATPSGTVANSSAAEGFLLSHEVNDAFIAQNRLVAAGEDVFWLTEAVTVGGETYPAGTIYIESKRSTAGRLAPLASELGLSFIGVSESPRSEALKMQRVRVGLWDRYGGSMPSGWTRWLFEQFEFPFEVVYPQRLNEGRLSRSFDVLVFVDGAIPAPPSAAGESGRFRAPADPARIPSEYHGWLGSVTADTTIPQLRDFMEDGGTIITIGSSAMNMASQLGLPVTNHLVDDSGRPLPGDQYYIPGSLLEVQVDNARPVAYGMNDRAIVSFNRSPVFRLESGAEAQGLRRLAWYASDRPLRSGWAVGQEHLDGGVAMIEADVGDGKLFMFGPGVVQRAQPHGTFKFLFNGIYLSTAEEDRVN
jgi:hypothetical protein